MQGCCFLRMGGVEGERFGFETPLSLRSQQPPISPPPPFGVNLFLRGQGEKQKPILPAPLVQEKILEAMFGLCVGVLERKREKKISKEAESYKYSRPSPVGQHDLVSVRYLIYLYVSARALSAELHAFTPLVAGSWELGARSMNPKLGGNNSNGSKPSVFRAKKRKKRGLQRGELWERGAGYVGREARRGVVWFLLTRSQGGAGVGKELENGIDVENLLCDIISYSNHERENYFGQLD